MKTKDSSSQPSRTFLPYGRVFIVDRGGREWAESLHSFQGIRVYPTKQEVLCMVHDIDIFISEDTIRSLDEILKATGVFLTGTSIFAAGSRLPSVFLTKPVLCRSYPSSSTT